MIVVRGRLSTLLSLALIALAVATVPAAARRAAAPAAAPAAPGPSTSNAGHASANFETRIAAVVNDQVISVYDLESRMRMALLSSNSPDTPEIRKRLAPQTLRTMVDEKLEMQEAKKQHVTASDDEINKALEQIEQQNNLKPGQLNVLLKAKDIDRGALVDQITASIVWTKLVRRRASQTIDISDEEIDEALKRLKEHADEPESRVAEIFLAVDNPAQDAEVRAQAEHLITEMRQGARFSAVAQQFSQSATAAVGGDIGWVRPDQLNPAMGKAVATMKPGELSPPIRTNAGYYVLLVIARRTGALGGDTEPTLKIVQVVFPLPQEPSEAAKRAAILEAQGIRSAAKTCADLLALGKEKAPRLSSEGTIRVSQIAPQLRALLEKLGIGQASPPIVQKNGVGVIMICSKSAPAGPTAITRQEAEETLLRGRLDTIARSYLRDLRRNAFVDVRVAGG